MRLHYDVGGARNILIFTLTAQLLASAAGACATFVGAAFAGIALVSGLSKLAMRASGLSGFSRTTCAMASAAQRNAVYYLVGHSRRASVVCSV